MAAAPLTWRVALRGGAVETKFVTIEFDPAQHTSVGEVAKAAAWKLDQGKIPQDRLALFRVSKEAAQPSWAQCNAAVDDPSAKIDLSISLNAAASRDATLPDEAWFVLDISTPAAGAGGAAAAGGVAVAGVDKALAKIVAQQLLLSLIAAKVEAAMDARIEATRRCISPEADARCSHAACVLTDGETPADTHIGVAIAVSGSRAVTAYHVVAPLLASGRRVVYGFTERRERIKLRIVPPSDDDKAVDVCALAIERDERARPAFLELTSAVPARGNSIVVIGYNVSTRGRIAGEFELKMGVMVGQVSATSAHHVLLQQPTFSGGSGAAVMLLDDKLVAMNVEGVNEARERFKHDAVSASDVGLRERMDAVKKSVASLVTNTRAGSLGVLAKCLQRCVADAGGCEVAAVAGAGHA